MLLYAIEGRDWMHEQCAGTSLEIPRRSGAHCSIGFQPVVSATARCLENSRHFLAHTTRRERPCGHTADAYDP